MNLLQNALKYSHSGFKDRDKTIDITYDLCDEKYLKIDICDVGCGITPQEIKSNDLFELGFRGELSSDRDRSGSGCGLYIAHNIATSHNGSIYVRSEPVNTANPANQAYKTNVALILPIIQD